MAGAAAALALLLWPPGATAAYPNPGLVTGDIGIHDPSMIRTDSGYALYGSNNLLDARTSPDRTAFSNAGSAFTGPQSWWSRYSPEQSPWAPDISYHNGTYWMYYAVSSFGSNTSAIGLATSDTGLPGSFTDQGIVHSTSSDSDYNAIDPSLLVDDDGTWWLAFGSWWSGIKMIQLDPATGKQHPDHTEVHSLASAEGGIEGPALIKHGDHYYLFNSYGTCCAGTDSTYHIKVGRSTSPTGPYADADGRSLLAGGGTFVLESHGRFIGPGGQSVLSDTDGDLLVYHYYDGEDNGAPKLGVNLLDWSSGWPVAY
ncbi:arabinan endo-1,5-alpha-L-arabinosidase [Streptomyces sp. DSM 44938]|uniref:Arabinan endo-1,5-alpha-L-arabinosidase n=1 Tax=Streptomyces litchfieldiae TaxID=3075543 RepID=A0ABU2ML30_9ACTN|nr:arabinan endo-1,5-alpha-L-arabinosidase [Streptomyces sp. DSM 44938]MDT0341834.1 arabinan endo-1,5-alpha-L-arabinosidase [Streptomyces sp. DSM 44938]